MKMSVRPTVRLLLQPKLLHLDRMLREVFLELARIKTVQNDWMINIVH